MYFLRLQILKRLKIGNIAKRTLKQIKKDLKKNDIPTKTGMLITLDISITFLINKLTQSVLFLNL